ncbi:MAG: UDP-N-acetylmuramate dehydrogenase [Rhodocyclaceae bacterium]|nr:MAG: UDP-N-acetylmuramate dehydrogenase [Rhodocyclaceae bacterium]
MGECEPPQRQARKAYRVNRYPVSSAIAQGNGYTIVENASLEGRNTFRVPARAHLLIDVKKPEALAEVLGFPYLKNSPVLVLGEGSNVLFTRDWPHVVLSMSSQGIAVESDEGDACRVRVAAGENWNAFVHWSLARGFAGLENLVLIPGSVGAAPIQNIGAYGVEVCEFIESVSAWDRHGGQPVELDLADCRFTYRDSVFKQEADRYIVTSVEFRLPRARDPRIGYAGIAEELKALGFCEPTHAQVAEAIARVRTRKLPNPALIGNAGSFFKNPLVGSAKGADLRQRHPDLPCWPTSDGQLKLSAAWLIESCGFKGLRRRHAGVSEHHALVLVNLGGASGAEIWNLAEEIRDTVHARYQVMLEPEPRIL